MTSSQQIGIRTLTIDAAVGVVGAPRPPSTMPRIGGIVGASPQRCSKRACRIRFTVGLLAYAITSLGDSSNPPPVASAPITVPKPTVSSPAASSPASARPSAPQLAPATTMTSPSQSRAPALPKANRGRHSSAGAVPALKPGAQPSFASLQHRLGSVAIAAQPLGQGRMQVLGGDTAMQAMSTSKILILSALLKDKGGVQNLSSDQVALAKAAITKSDNSAILDLFQALEADHGGLVGASAYATSLLRRAGDDRTQVATAPPPAGYATSFGQTPWPPSSEVRFLRALALGCILPSADLTFELGLMSEIEPSESFGLGSAGFSRVAFKGGWGPEPGGQYGVRQTGIVGHGGSAVVVSLIVDPATGFGAGQTVLDQLAQWLRGHLQLTSRPRASCSA